MMSFAKNYGSKRFKDLKNNYRKANIFTIQTIHLNSITKKEILDQIEKFHDV